MGYPDGLAAFQRARLDEDEAGARLAARKGGTWTQGDPGQGSCAITSLGGTVVYDEGRPDEHQAAHIARHDPARVLREVAAMRERLALYLDAKETLAVALRKAPPEDDPAAAHSYVRERINVNQASGRFAALEMSVRLDAMVYSDHPDYDPSWKP